MELYESLAAQAKSLLYGEDDLICAMANISALIFESVPDLNWAGFYREKDGGLILGPFQGKVACTRIACGRGVCGTAMATDEPQLVPNVHEFAGHIACDSASNAEIVLPLHGADGRFLGVLDIDSPTVGRFGERDLDGFRKIAELFKIF